MAATTPTNAELKEVGLEREEFESLGDEGKAYVLDRLKSYDMLDKLYQITEIIRALEKERGKDATTILATQENRNLIIDVVKDYRKQDRIETVAEFYQKWIKRKA